MRARNVGPDTVLSGLLADQSALFGVIHQIEALALELLEVRSRSAPSCSIVSRTSKLAEASPSQMKGDLR
jgi:hypothetical protein